MMMTIMVLEMARYHFHTQHSLSSTPIYTYDSCIISNIQYQPRQYIHSKHIQSFSQQTFNINHANIYIANIYSHFHNKHSISTTPIYTQQTYIVISIANIHYQPRQYIHISNRLPTDPRKLGNNLYLVTKFSSRSLYSR